MIGRKRQIFYSLHFDNDVRRAQQIRNNGALEDNKPVSASEWEEIKKRGESSIKKWIDERIAYCSCVIVLVGEETADRKWVKYEIKRAWESGKGLVGIYIHKLIDPRTSKIPPYYGESRQGQNPFDQFRFVSGKRLSSVVKCYNPNSTDTCTYIKNNIEGWVEEAIQIRVQKINLNRILRPHRGI